jgi:hypothetical protein
MIIGAHSILYSKIPGADRAFLRDQGWGLLTQVTLPGGGKLGIYQPRHARPRTVTVRKKAARKKKKKVSRRR